MHPHPPMQVTRTNNSRRLLRGFVWEESAVGLLPFGYFAEQQGLNYPRSPLTISCDGATSQSSARAVTMLVDFGQIRRRRNKKPSQRFFLKLNLTSLFTALFNVTTCARAQHLWSMHFAKGCMRAMCHNGVLKKG